MAKKNPFSHNPLAPSDKPELVKVPDAPETHEPRKPLRAWLGKPGADSGAAAPKAKRIIERVREVAAAEQVDEVPLPAPRRRR